MGLEFFKRKTDIGSMAAEATRDVSGTRLSDALKQILATRSDVIKPAHLEKGKQAAARRTEGLDFVFNLFRGRADAEKTQEDFVGEAEKVLEGQRKALKEKSEAQRQEVRVEQKLLKIMAKAGSGDLSKEDIEFYEAHKNDKPVEREDLVKATDAVMVDNKVILEAEAALAKVRGNLPTESLQKEKALSDEFEETQAKQFAHAEAILEVVDSANGAVLTKEQLDIAIAYARKFSGSERVALGKLTILADRLQRRYPEEWKEKGKTAQEYATEVGAKKLSLREKPLDNDEQLAVQAEAAHLLDNLSKRGLNEAFLADLAKKLGVKIEGEGNSKAVGFVEGSIGAELAQWSIYGNNLAVEAKNAREMLKDDRRVADSVVVIEATRYRADLRVKMLNERVKTLIDKAVLDQMIDLEKKKAEAEANVEKQNRLLAKQAEAQALANKMYDKRQNTVKDIYAVPERAFGGLKKLFGRMEAYFGKTKETQMRKVEGQKLGNQFEQQADMLVKKMEMARLDAQLAEIQRQRQAFLDSNPELNANAPSAPAAPAEAPVAPPAAPEAPVPETPAA